MFMPRSIALPLALALVAFVAACGDKNPTTPTPSATRIMRLDGTLNFGDVVVGEPKELSFRIFNDGTATLTVSALQPSGGGTYVASWSSGTVAPGASQSVTLRFTPAAVQNYAGVLVVAADQTAGPSQMTIAARGVAAP